MFIATKIVYTRFALQVLIHKLVLDIINNPLLTEKEDIDKDH